MRADATNTTNNVATLTFDVTTYPDLPDGTVISNQAFVSAVGAGIVDYPSDNPRTPIVNDPTRDVVGNCRSSSRTKRAVLLIDQSSPGVVDPGDTLRYTITIYNTGAIAATNVVLSDVVPANTTYVANSVLLNGLPVGQPDGGVSPLVAGVYVSSTDLTPPLPAAGEGVLSPRAPQAVVQFDLRVNAGVPTGTRIVNQAIVRTAELPNVLTDGDGNRLDGTRADRRGRRPRSATRDRPRRLRSSAAARRCRARRSSTSYASTTFRSRPRSMSVITDDISMPTPGYLTLVDQSVTMNGVTTGVSVVGPIITADYSTSYGALLPGRDHRFALPRCHQSESPGRHADQQHGACDVERPAARPPPPESRSMSAACPAPAS